MTIDISREMAKIGNSPREYTRTDLYNEIADVLSKNKEDDISIEAIKKRVLRIERTLKNLFSLDIHGDRCATFKLIMACLVVEDEHDCYLRKIFSEKRELNVKHKSALSDLKVHLGREIEGGCAEDAEALLASLGGLWKENQLLFTKKYLYNALQDESHNRLDNVDVDRLIDHCRYRANCVRDNPDIGREASSSIIVEFYYNILKLEFRIGHQEHMYAINELKPISSPITMDLKEYYNTYLESGELIRLAKENRDFCQIVTGDNEKRRTFLKLLDNFVMDIYRFAKTYVFQFEHAPNLLYILSFLQEVWLARESTEQINNAKFRKKGDRSEYSVLSAVHDDYKSDYFDSYWSLRVLRRMCLNCNFSEGISKFISFEQVYHELILKLMKIPDLHHLKTVHDYALMNIKLLLMPNEENEQFIRDISEKLSSVIRCNVVIEHVENALFSSIIRDSFKIIDKRTGIKELITLSKEFVDYAKCAIPLISRELHTSQLKTSVVLDSIVSNLSVKYTLIFRRDFYDFIENQRMSEMLFTPELRIAAVEYVPANEGFASIIEKYLKDTALSAEINDETVFIPNRV